MESLSLTLRAKFDQDIWTKYGKELSGYEEECTVLLGGAVGRYLTSILAKEIQALTAEQKSEKSAMLSKLILQKDKKIVKSSNIRRLLRRRMKMWEEDLFDQLIEEAELCDRKFGRAVGENMSEDEAIKIFTRLIKFVKLHDTSPKEVRKEGY